MKLLHSYSLSSTRNEFSVSLLEATNENNSSKRVLAALSNLDSSFSSRTVRPIVSVEGGVASISSSSFAPDGPSSSFN